MACGCLSNIDSLLIEDANPLGLVYALTELADRVSCLATRRTQRGGLQVKADAHLLGVTAWPYSMADLETATHDIELPKRDYVTVNPVGFQTGVGGDTSWGLPVHDQYRLKRKGEYGFAFTLRELSPQ